MKEIIIVDDEPLILSAYERILSKEFDNLHAFNNTYEAFKFINDNPKTIVITDIGMPGVNGTKFTHKISEDYPDARVIVTSGQLDPALRKDLSDTGVVLGMLDKPIKISELVDIIQQNLQ
jgi:DNA-binding NarL/FixJ family response regulator